MRSRWCLPLLLFACSKRIEERNLNVRAHDAAAAANDAARPEPVQDAPVTDAATARSEAGAEQTDASSAPGFEWQLPYGFPEPAVPEANPMSAAKVELGRHLFYDARLSQDDTFSCATCHHQELAFTDGGEYSLGVTGAHTPRSSMSLANVAYASTLTWANPLLLELERQALVPMFGDDPVELGLGSSAELEAKLRADPTYVELFSVAFPDSAEPITVQAVVRALAAFERTLISGNSPFDHYLAGDKNAISASARRGYELFGSEKLECFHCHAGFAFTDHVNYSGKAFFDDPFHNTGLYNTDSRGAYPEPNTGVFSVTGREQDMGRFKAPTLRNVALTAPYMHDGSIATLSEVLDHYAAGGRTVVDGESAGVGSASPLKSNLIQGFALTEDERADVLAFLQTLTDEEFLSDPRFEDPWLNSP